MRHFIEQHTTVTTAPLVPEIRLHLATAITPIWQATEAWLHEQNIPPPYWAFAWPGSQVLARHILDHPHLAAGRRILDFAAGSGLAAIACALAGAKLVEAVEIDPLAGEAARLNAALNGVTLTTTIRDIVGDPCRWDLILCGDVCYEAPMTAHIVPWLQHMAASAEVWIADPARNYLPPGLEPFATYAVPTSLELEDAALRHTCLFHLREGTL